MVLERRGYQVIRSFDLQSALSYQVEHCACPHQQRDECTCQYVVLLAYPPAASDRKAPRVFTARGYEQVTHVALQRDGSIDQGERFALTSALVEAAMLLSLGQVAGENQVAPAPSD
jgi:hypothetical protein